MSTEYYKQKLQNIKYISVREKTAVNIIKTVTGQEAVAVADPTLLLDEQEWSEVLNDSMVPQEKYILLYVLKESSYITEMALNVAKEKGLKVVRICRGAYRQDSKNSPILNKDFYTIVSRNADNNSRQIDLLSTLGIDRIKYTDTQFTENLPIEWDIINGRVEKYRRESIDYLQKVINDEK